jgi:ABC-type multidrug transport system fused ATPase/permease subunit
VISTIISARGAETAPQPLFLWQTAKRVAELTLQTTDLTELKKHVRGNENLNYYLSIYAFIAFLFCVATFARIVIVSLGSIRASKRMHEQLLSRIVHAKARFLDKTPMGQILNRFSKDLETIDQELAMVALGFIHDTLTIAITVVLITFITPGFLVAGVLITAIYTVVGAFYIRSSRELKRLESVTRSPIYQHFGETLTGVVTIRAYGDNLRFIRDNLNNIDTNNRPFYYLWALNRWLSVRVDLGGALVSFFAAIFVIMNVDKLDAGLAGISLTYAISFTDHVLWCVRLYSMLEMSMNSVERIDEYLEIEQEAPAIVEEHRVPKGWPSKGAIDVEHLVLQYAPDLPAVIKDVSFKVEAGAKIGIVGRTGAGKSTIATAFFRLIEPTSGRITIDGVDIAKIGLRELRQGLTIIPQDPTLFQRTLRYNLDPFGEHTDTEIFEALRRVHLIGESSASSVAQAGDENINVFFNLDTQIAEGGNNLSQGQKQLLCLARALLRMPRVILMDESTASVDHLTDAKIQKTIRLNFKHSTILTIAHRLRSIVDYDKILVLDAGQVKEFNHPHLLMQDKESVFREMCAASGEFDVLAEMAKQAFEEGPLVNIA